MPVTALTESAAPPRASPSSLVITTPSNSVASANCSATLTASWPVIASTASSTSCGFVRFLIWTSSSIRSASTWRRPAVSMISASRPWALAWPSAHSAMSTGSRSVPCWKTSTPACSPSRWSWSTAAGRCVSQAATATLLPSSLRKRASFAVAVVLPEPCRPAIRITVGPLPFGAKTRSRPEPPISSVSCSLTTLTTISPGFRLDSTPSPIAFSRTPATNCLVTLKLTSASSRARRISRIALSTSSSLSLPRERRSDIVPWRRSESWSNIEAGA